MNNPREEIIEDVRPTKYFLTRECWHSLVKGTL